jgi:hypothetical protein
MTSGFVPLSPGLGRRLRMEPHEDLRLARWALLVVLMLEFAVVGGPRTLLLSPLQATPLYKQVSGYSMISVLVFAMAFGWLRRLPAMATRQKMLNALHQAAGLILLLLLGVHVGARPSGFLLVLFHATAAGLGAGALRTVLGARAPKRLASSLLAAHIGLTCGVSAGVLLHLYLVYAYAR